MLNLTDYSTQASFLTKLLIRPQTKLFEKIVLGPSVSEYSNTYQYGLIKGFIKYRAYTSIEKIGGFDSEWTDATEYMPPEWRNGYGMFATISYDDRMFLFGKC